MTPSSTSPRNRTTIIPSPIPNRSSARTWKARCGCWRPPGNTTCVSTTSAPTRYTAIWRWMIRRVSRKTRRTVPQARTAPRRRRPTIWCAHGCAHTACAPPSPTAPTTTAHTSMWRSSSHGRSPPSWRARGRNCTAPARTCATGYIRKTTPARCGRSSPAGASAKRI